MHKILDAVNKICHGIDTINEYFGKLVRWVVVVLCLVMVYDVFMRYVLNRPTIWAFDVSTALYAATFMLSGAWALLYKSHVAIDVLYEKASAKVKAILDLITYTVWYYPFMTILLVFGWRAFVKSVERGETKWFGFAMPMWPIRIQVPIFAALMMIQGTATILRSIMTIITGELYESRYKKEAIKEMVLPEALESADEVERRLKGGGVQA